MNRTGLWFILMTLSLTLALAQSKPSLKAKVSMAEARHTALAKHPGKIKGAELETEDGRLVYSFDIQMKAELREVQVDAHTGQIVSDKVETAEDETKEKTEEQAKKAGAKKPYR